MFTKQQRIRVKAMQLDRLDALTKYSRGWSYVLCETWSYGRFDGLQELTSYLKNSLFI